MWEYVGVFDTLEEAIGCVGSGQEFDFLTLGPSAFVVVL